MAKKKDRGPWADETLSGDDRSHGQTGGELDLFGSAQSHNQTGGKAWLHRNAQSHNQIGGEAWLHDFTRSYGQIGGKAWLLDNAESHGMRGGTLHVRSSDAKVIDHRGGTVIWEEWNGREHIETRRVVKPDAALADRGMVHAGDLADYAAGRIPGPAYLWLGGFDRFAEIASVNADWWVTEGRGWLTSSWCCHPGTAVYRKA